MKIRLVGAEWLDADRETDGRTDGRSDMKKLIVPFRNFAKAPNNCFQLANLSVLQFLPLGSTHIHTLSLVSHSSDPFCGVKYQNCTLVIRGYTVYSDTSANENNSFRNHIR